MTTASQSLPLVDETTVTRLLNDADEFALEALASGSPKTLQHAAWALNEPPEQQRIVLRTAFLFPELPRWQQALLVTVYWHRQMLLALLKLNQNGCPTPPLTTLLRGWLARLNKRLCTLKHRRWKFGDSPVCRPFSGECWIRSIYKFSSIRLVSPWELDLNFTSAPGA